MTPFQYARNIIVAGGNQYLRNDDYVAYEQGTLNALMEIMKNNWTGYGIILLISEMRGKEVIITPNFSQRCNASAGLPSWKSANQIEIVYSPLVFGKSTCASPGFTPDEALLHELIHAYRQLRHGLVKEAPIFAPKFNYDNFEEFVAILLTNIYASAKKKTVLRKDHGATTLPQSLSQSDTFFKNENNHAKPIHDLIIQDYFLIQNYVRKDDGIFNPVKYFFSHSDECVAMIPGPLVPDP
jgi:hypothetical protein